jgi:glutamate/tyrosine decarboxylase-like PLP-dependent enzyme
MSADLHKYGYTAKGASVVLFRDAELRKFQPYDFRNWPRGTYSTPNMTGTRPGGALAAAWAVMQYLGRQGYVQLAESTMDTVNKLKSGIDAIPGLQVLGKPAMSVFGYGSDELDIFAVAEEMTGRGWYVNRLQEPHGIHMNVTASHAAIADAYLKDLASVTDDVRRRNLKSTETEIRYA